MSEPKLTLAEVLAPMAQWNREAERRAEIEERERAEWEEFSKGQQWKVKPPAKP